MTAAHRISTTHRVNYARAGIVVLAGLTALAAVFLMNPSKGEAAQTHYVTYDALGGDKGNMNANVGDTVVFQNALPLAPLTGALVPVSMTYDGESFSVGGTPVSRTITKSTSYVGTYSVLGLVPLTTTRGTITAADKPAPPPPGGGNPPPGGGNPPPGGGNPPPGGGNPPPGGGGGTTPPAGGGTTPGGTTPGGTTPTRPAGDPGTVPAGAGTANGPQVGSGAITGQTPSAANGQAPVVAPKTGSNTTIVPGAATDRPRALTNTGSTTGGLGLTAMLGAILLLGVGIALARTLISGRVSSPATV